MTFSCKQRTISTAVGKVTMLSISERILAFRETWIRISTIYGWTHWKMLETMGLMPKNISGWDSLKLFQLFDKRIQCQFLSSLANIGVFFFIRRKKWKQFYIPELLSYRPPNSRNHHIYKAAGKPIGYWLRRTLPRKGGTEGNSFRGHIVAIVSQAAFQITVGGFCCI